MILVDSLGRSSSGDDKELVEFAITYTPEGVTNKRNKLDLARILGALCTFNPTVKVEASFKVTKAIRKAAKSEAFPC